MDIDDPGYFLKEDESRGTRDFETWICRADENGKKKNNLRNVFE
jgi:hypothetical protein